MRAARAWSCVALTATALLLASCDGASTSDGTDPAQRPVGALLEAERTAVAEQLAATRARAGHEPDDAGSSDAATDADND